ncbi:hypothetical protein ACFRQM_09570 [Streptomyces sp. NPDC056831]|uniref:hypothetical protein n=1 Tax=Streptomyces sp. NPDC056831 TaxID=3345954 RepID=UPI0036C4782F
MTSPRHQPRAVRYFHGGVPGLRPGDLITPHPPNVVDGCPVCAARAAGEPYTVPGLGVIDPPTGRPDRVYVTTDREYGFFYASRWYHGDLYVVEPLGGVEPSMEDPFPTWCAEAARVRSVYSRCVQLTPAQRRRLLVRWAAVDIATASAARGAVQ